MGTRKQSGTALQTREAEGQEARHIFWTAFFELRDVSRMEGHVKALESLVSVYAQLANPSGEFDKDNSDRLNDARRLAWSALKIESQVPRFDPNGLKAAFVSAVTTWLETCNLKADWVRDDLLGFLDFWARGHFEFGMLPFLAVSNSHKVPATFWEPPILPRFDAGHVSESEYRARAMLVLEKYISDSTTAYKEVGLREPTAHTEAHRHSVWLIRFQVLGARYEDVAITEGVDDSTVRRAVKHRAELLGLSLRWQGKDGRPRKN